MMADPMTALRFPLDQILLAVRAHRLGQGAETLNLGGHTVSLRKTALRTFAFNDPCCSGCAVQASHFELVPLPGPRGEPGQLTLQMVGEKDGERVVFTQDHTWARALGGSNHPSNLTTMCLTCNHEKSRQEMAVVTMLRTEAGLSPMAKGVGRDPEGLEAALKRAGKHHLWLAHAQAQGAPKPVPPLDEERLLVLKQRLAARAAALGLSPEQYRRSCEQVAHDRVLTLDDRRLAPHAAQMALSIAAYRTFQDDHASRLEAAPILAPRLIEAAQAAGIAPQAPRVVPVAPMPPRRRPGRH